MAPGEFNLFRMGERVATNQVALEQEKKYQGRYLPWFFAAAIKGKRDERCC